MGTWTNYFSALTGGGKRDRTADLLHAMQALSQLSYTPKSHKANFKKAQDIQNNPRFYPIFQRVRKLLMQEP